MARAALVCGRVSGIEASTPPNRAQARAQQATRSPMPKGRARPVPWWGRHDTDGRVAASWTTASRAPGHDCTLGAAERSRRIAPCERGLDARPPASGEGGACAKRSATRRHTPATSATSPPRCAAS
eukprot:6904920-Prymnesium_polylepis.1